MTILSMMTMLRATADADLGLLSLALQGSLQRLIEC
jgi:hypothetical protein